MEVNTKIHKMYDSIHMKKQTSLIVAILKRWAEIEMMIFDFVNQIISNISLHTIFKRKVKSKELNILSMMQNSKHTQKRTRILLLLRKIVFSLFTIIRVVVID